MKHIGLFAFLFLFISKAVLGAGFALSEYSTSNLARGFAGMGVAGDDYSAIVSNPAGMSLKNDGMQAGMSVINIKAEAFDVDNPSDRAEVDITSPVPFLFVQNSLTDKMKLGFAFYVPYGLGTEYDDDWYGRNHALLSEVVVYDLTSSLSYDVSSKFSVGASLSLQYMTAQLSNDSDSTTPPVPSLIHSEIEGESDPAVAYTLGLMYKPTDSTRFGISYRSKSDFDLNGDHVLTNNMDGSLIGKGDAFANITLPEHVLFSAYHKIGKFGLAAGAKWTRWSRFKNLDIYSDINGLNRTEENWKNTWAYSVGLDYDLSDVWVLRAGVQYDETGISSEEHRTARIPDNDRIITALGGSYKFNGGQIDMAYAHIFLDDNYADYEGLNSNYSMGVNMLSFAVQYYF